jgi:hypothetical protein
MTTLDVCGRQRGAGEGNRTLVVSLEGFCSTIELHPLITVQMSMAKNFVGGKQPASARQAKRKDDHDKQAKHRHRNECAKVRKVAVNGIQLSNRSAKDPKVVSKSMKQSEYVTNTA